MPYNSTHTGAQIDAGIALSQANKTDITNIQAALAVLNGASGHITGLLIGTIAINATFATLVAQDFTATVTGADVGDLVLLYPLNSSGYPATIGNANNLMCIGAWVSAANTVTGRWMSANMSGSVLYNFTFKVLVLKIHTS